MFDDRKRVQEKGKELRKAAMKDRILGQFNAANQKYKKAEAAYEKLGDVDSQCNVLCSRAETAGSTNERQKCVEKIETLCANIQDPGEKQRSLRNLDALKKRLGNS